MNWVYLGVYDTKASVQDLRVDRLNLEYVRTLKVTLLPRSKITIVSTDTGAFLDKKEELELLQRMGLKDWREVSIKFKRCLVQNDYTYVLILDEFRVIEVK